MTAIEFENISKQYRLGLVSTLNVIFIKQKLSQRLQHLNSSTLKRFNND